MSTTMKKIGIALLAIVFALGLTVPALSFAEPGGRPTMTGMAGANEQAAIDAATSGAVAAEAVEDAAMSDVPAISEEATEIPVEEPDGATVEEPVEAVVDENATGDATVDEVVTAPAGDCVVTIQYLEYTEDIEGKPVDEGGRVILGTRELTGLNEGDQIHAWDYVVDIPGYFFFDGWPLNMTVSADPSQNVLKLIYMKIRTGEYTVNYYLMTGADLTADNWGDALDTDKVTFSKIGSEQFDDAQLNSLVQGDAYEYQVDGLYVIDTYPSEILVDEQPDDNVINVLYTNAVAYGPSDLPVPDGVVPDGGDGAGGDANVTLPPNDTTLDKDEIEAILPDDPEVVGDLIGTGGEEVTITDAMLENPVNKEQAIQTVKAYQTGLQQGAGLSQTGDGIVWLVVALAVVIVGAGIAIGILLRRRQLTPAPIPEKTKDV